MSATRNTMILLVTGLALLGCTDRLTPTEVSATCPASAGAAGSCCFTGNGCMPIKK
jgi:hypothetical protein